MTNTSKDKPKLSPEGERNAQARQERSAAALRANLLRRKAQARQREAPPLAKKP